MTENGNRYEQFEISPETIEQELRPVYCEQRQTDSRIYDEDTTHAMRTSVVFPVR